MNKFGMKHQLFKKIS